MVSIPTMTMFVRASNAVEDALASDDNSPDDIARAVLMAIREPDDEITSVGDNFLDDCPSWAGLCFETMIDAILSEPQP